MSNCVFNFNILALVVSEILEDPKFTLGGSVPPVRPYGKHFCARGEYFTMPNGIFNFNFLALVFAEILGGPKFTPGALGENICVLNASTLPYLTVILVSTF